jgi:hypothetical protein
MKVPKMKIVSTENYKEARNDFFVWIQSSRGTSISSWPIIPAPSDDDDDDDDDERGAVSKVSSKGNQNTWIKPAPSAALFTINLT